jgi:hypothetical protein
LWSRQPNGKSLNWGTVLCFMIKQFPLDSSSWDGNILFTFSLNLPNWILIFQNGSEFFLIGFSVTKFRRSCSKNCYTCSWQSPRF